MKNLSLRLRLMILFVGFSCLIWATAGFICWQESKEKIDEFFDSYQMLLARQMASADWSHVSMQTQKITNKIIKNIKNAEDEDEAIGFAVFNADGKMIFHDNENGKDFTFRPEIGTFRKQKVDVEWWRIVWVKSADGNFYIAIGQEREYRTDITMDMVEEFLAPWLGGLGLLLVLTIIIISREFSPLKKLASDLENRLPDDLSPLTGKNLPSEVRPMIEAINRRMAQIDDLLQRERSFISDSAHELRTPLTALKIQLEVAELAGNDQKMRQVALQKLGIGIERSARLVEQLLALSRLEAKQAQNEVFEQIDWDNIVRQIKDEYASAAAAKNISFQEKLAVPAVIHAGNPVLCALLMRNLIDNAIKYSPEGAVISIELNTDHIKVINSGAHVETAHLNRLSERFFRPAGQKENGSGLGLAIVSRIAGLYGCCLHFANTSKGFEVRIEKENI